MAVAKIIEIIAGSKVSFEDAIKQGVARAAETVSDISSAWVKNQSVVVEGGKVVEYRVEMKITFILKAAPRAAAKKKAK
jgi:dodecin